MSLTSTLNGAAAGLALLSRRAALVSSNVARSGEDGYRHRSLEPEIGRPGGAIVRRHADPALLADTRLARGAAEAGDARLAALARLEAAFGDPDAPGSLQRRLAAFDAALVDARADPADPGRLTAAARGAAALVEAVRAAAAAVAHERTAAEAGIATAVAGLDRDLADVAAIDVRIRQAEAAGHDASDLRDRRETLVDRISAVVPVREMPRDDGTSALVTTGGLVLLDGRHRALEFQARRPVAPDMVQGVQLQWPSLGGRAIDPARDLAGGALAAMFELRDDDLPRAGARLDAFAAELAARLDAADPSLGPGEAGLLTDAGGPASAGAPPGLAGRLALNAALDPGDPGTHWRLGAGLGAAAAPDPDAAFLGRASAALGAARPPLDPRLGAAPATVAALAADLRSALSGGRLAAQEDAAAAAGRLGSLLAQDTGRRIDLDAEMQHLLAIEKAYAAHARVIEAASDMQDRLTRI